MPADPDALARALGGVRRRQGDLRGRVPDQATADEIADQAGAVVGAENVRRRVHHRPVGAPAGRPRCTSTTRSCSAPAERTLNAKARATLDLGVTLLTICSPGHLRHRGPHRRVGRDRGHNLALSQRRVDAIVAYLVGPRGRSGPADRGRQGRVRADRRQRHAGRSGQEPADRDPASTASSAEPRVLQRPGRLRLVPVAGFRPVISRQEASASARVRVRRIDGRALTMSHR